MSKRVGLVITTYEIDDQGESNPTLSHTFWGKDINDAMGIAISHCYTDEFFSSSFIGEMPWKDIILHMENDIDVIGAKPHRAQLDKLYHDLQTRAVKIQREKKKIGLVQLITDLSLKSK